MKIALDAMGTDLNPVADVAGAVLAARDFPQDTILLVGDKAIIEAELQKHITDGLKIEIVHAPEAIHMGDKPNQIVRGKPSSSMHVGMKLLEDGQADAFVTAGNTGAALAIATTVAPRRIAGVKRPAITAVGELAGNLIVVVDVGANTDTKLEWLTQFAIMGDLYARKVLNIPDARVGLLSNGEEEGKGNQLVQEAGEAFKQLPIRFIGNVEPHDLFNGKVDVIVTDGYVGNILLKTYEATVSTLFKTMRAELTSSWWSRLGAAIVRPGLRKVVKQMDPTQYGGAPLLGLNGVVIITHGGSDATVIRNSIAQARRAVESNIIEAIRSGLAEPSNSAS
ncbi:MAG: phosphate acyltransferase PlsX [Phototrophicaceae bacterium]